MIRTERQKYIVSWFQDREKRIENEKKNKERTKMSITHIFITIKYDGYGVPSCIHI